MSCRVALVDDDQGILDTLSLGISNSPGFTCVGCYTDGLSALELIPKTRVDVVLMDLKMPGMSGIECTVRLKAIQPNLPVVMLTGTFESQFFFEALMAGASGYLTKPTTTRECVAGIMEVVTGGAPLSREVARILVTSFHHKATAVHADTLTVREKEIMACLFRGLSDKEITKHFGIGKATVHTHLHRIFEKLDARNRTDAVRKFLKLSDDVNLQSPPAQSSQRL